MIGAEEEIFKLFATALRSEGGNDEQALFDRAHRVPGGWRRLAGIRIPLLPHT